MILFIDLRSQETGHRFAFFNTVSDVFCDFYGDQAWSDKDEFVRSFNLYVTNCIAGNNDSIDRFLRLMPPWAEKSSKDEGDACPFDRCIGVLRFAKVQNCSCHISPPCGECENKTLHCSECGWSPGDPEEPPVVVEKASQLALDVSLETARALHRVWRALNDGDCPKCHHAVAATDVIRPNLKDGVWLKCPNTDCAFQVMGEEITEIERMFAPAMDAAVNIFEQWRASRL